MRTVVNVFHPNLADASRVNRTVASSLAEAGFEVRDVAALYRDRGPDVAVEQAVCERADRLVFVHPFHWSGCPWPMKRWIDEVLTYGWAYGGPDRLAGKEWLSVVSVGAKEADYGPGTARETQVHELLRTFEETAIFCRMDWRPPILLFGAGSVAPEDLQAFCDGLPARILGG